MVVTDVEFLKSDKIDPAWRSEIPGTILKVTERGPVVRTGDGALLIASLKPEGSREMDGGSFLRGRPLQPLSDMLLGD